jgi:hypothetical protein
MPDIVILSKAKNLMASGAYLFEILGLAPQNDVVGQPLYTESSEATFMPTLRFERIEDRGQNCEWRIWEGIGYEG